MVRAKRRHASYSHVEREHRREFQNARGSEGGLERKVERKAQVSLGVVNEAQANSLQLGRCLGAA